MLHATLETMKDDGGSEAPRVDLARYDNSWYNPGQGFVARTLWHLISALVLQNPLNPSSRLAVGLLRAFGAKIGRGVVIKPGVNVKYPWNLSVGNYSWIGEGAWLDSLAPIAIGSNVCISQGAYLCTGNHDWNDPHFGLIVKSIIIEDGAWIGARATVLPGVTIGSHAVAAAGAVVTKDVPDWTICVGNPAVPVKRRILKGDNVKLTS